MLGWIMTSKDRLDVQKLRFRRQFLLGPRSVQEFADWPSASVGHGLIVHAHPDLPLLQVTREPFRITLLGYLIDPEEPDLDDHGLLSTLMSRCSRARDLPVAAAGLCGRFVIVADDGSDTVLFSDPCALRETFFVGADFGETWCASQPDRIADVHGLSCSDAAKRFMAGDYYQRHHEPWWPGGTTQYSEVERLRANHFLDLRTRIQHRFWPNRHLEHWDLETAAQRCAEILRGLMTAAHKRFPLALPLTSGWDSRTILAASRGMDDIWHYTAHRAGLTGRSADMRIPPRLLQKLGRKHTVIKCPPRMSAPFANLYRMNTFPAHDAAGAIAEGLLGAFPEGRVSVSGHCSEIVRDTSQVPYWPPPGAEELAADISMDGDPYAIELFGRWLEETSPTVEKFGYHIWEFFSWEQEYATWAANGQGQWDLLHERLTPFNSRVLLDVMTGVDLPLRRGPDYAIFTRIMQILWPDVLSEPINPRHKSLAARIRARAGSIRRRITQAAEQA